MAIQVQGSKNKKTASSSVASPLDYLVYPTSSQFNILSSRYYGTADGLAYDHEKDIHKDTRRKIHKRLDSLLTMAGDYIIERKYEEALNWFIQRVFPESLKLIADIEMAFLKKSIREEAKKGMIVDDGLDFSDAPVVSKEERLISSLLTLPRYFYKKMNDQISNLIAHSNKCKEKGVNGWDGSFLRTQMKIRVAELYRGVYVKKSGKKLKYAGENYPYLITKVVDTLWKTFLFVYSLDTGNGLLAIKEEVWFQLDDYLKGGRDLKPFEVTIPIEEAAVDTKVCIEDILLDTEDKEAVESVANQYGGKEEDEDKEEKEDWSKLSDEEVDKKIDEIFC